jgi:oligopeptide transport system permease protein
VKYVFRYLGPVSFFGALISIAISFMGYEVPSFLLFGTLGLIALFFTVHTVANGMGAFLLRRLFQTVLTLAVVASLTFFLLRMVPGGPFDSERALPPEIKANIEAKYNLNAPLYVQYFDYMKNLARGDMGQSYKYVGRDVSEIVMEAFPVSFQLGVYALTFAFIWGIIGGIIAASKHNTWWDRSITIFAVISVSVPSFLVAAILIVVFCFWIDLFPVAMWDGPSYYILPILALGSRPVALICRLTRASVLDVIQSDYVRTAKAKGLSDNVVLFKHVLKNSLIPVLTVSGPLVAGLLSGTFVVEHIFNIPGMGKHFIQSVTNRDYPLVMALTLMFSTMLVFANLLVDILYTYFDPRIKMS